MSGTPSRRRPLAAAAPARVASTPLAAANPGEVQDDRAWLPRTVPSWLASLLLHIVALIVMGLVTFSSAKEEFFTSLVSERPDTSDETVIEIEEREIAPPIDPAIRPVDDPILPTVDPVDPSVEPEPHVSPDDTSAPTRTDLNPLGDFAMPNVPFGQQPGAITGTDPFGRGPKGQAEAVRIGDASRSSQDAVALALKWLAAHQLPDGGWSFDHRGGACQGRCRNHGSMAEARNGATGLALLAFLGAGQTHKEGQYKQVVEKGLYFLLRSMKVKGGQTGDLSEAGGNMYSHGICSIVLCEAYAMTNDRGLKQPAQLAINHIVFAQDPVGGGWRYTPKQAGDTSVVGWQLMALKSGHLAYLQVPKETVIGASKFLDSVQVEYAQYGYTTPAAGRNATTAVGLLCRMYLGWKHDHQGIVDGAKILDGIGPDFGNMYYSYYATQVVRHYGGEPWKRWNAKMRDPLVALQAKSGHEAGSWHMTGGDHGFAPGGRLYCTAMATMMLEVYYRHLPIYRKAAADEDFRL